MCVLSWPPSLRQLTILLHQSHCMQINHMLRNGTHALKYHENDGSLVYSFGNPFSFFFIFCSMAGRIGKWIFGISFPWHADEKFAFLHHSHWLHRIHYGDGFSNGDTNHFFFFHLFSMASTSLATATPAMAQRHNTECGTERRTRRIHTHTHIHMGISLCHCVT